MPEGSRRPLSTCFKGNPLNPKVDCVIFYAGGTTRADDAQGTPTQSHISPSIPVHEDHLKRGSSHLRLLDISVVYVPVVYVSYMCRICVHPTTDG